MQAIVIDVSGATRRFSAMSRCPSPPWSLGHVLVERLDAALTRHVSPAAPTARACR